MDVRLMVFDPYMKLQNLVTACLVDNFPEIVICGIADTLEKGRSLVKEHSPDIVVVYHEKRNKHIEALIKEWVSSELQVIVISSFADFAIEAIKHQLTGFILIPFNANEMIRSLNRALQNVWSKNSLVPLIENELISVTPNFIAISMLSKIELLVVDSILFCEAQGRYTLFHMKNFEQKISSKNLGAYEKLLWQLHFFRIHHKYLVNLNNVKSIVVGSPTKCELINGDVLPISMRKYRELRNYLSL